MPEVIAGPPPATTAPPAASPGGDGRAAPSAPAGGSGSSQTAPPKGGSNAAPNKTAKPVSKPANDLTSAYDQLDQIAARGETETTDETKPDAGNVPVVDEDEQPDSTERKPGDTTPTAEKGRPEKAATLRQKLDEIKAEYEKSQGRVKELETQAAQPREDGEKVKLTARLGEQDKRIAQLEEELRFTNYERHPEYKERYETPFIEAYAAGRNKVASFKLVGEDGNERQGTAQDFDRFMRITDDNEAAERAAEMFGNKASMVMYHREQVQQLNAARTKALEEYRKNGGERERIKNETASKQKQELAALWETECKTAVENPKYAPWFKAKAGDELGAELLSKGFEFADEAFGKPVKDVNGKPIVRNPQEIAKMHAVVRNKAAAFDYQIHRNQLLTKELRELKKKLANFESSVPGNGSGRGKNNAPLSGWTAVDADLARRADR